MKKTWKLLSLFSTFSLSCFPILMVASSCNASESVNNSSYLLKQLSKLKNNDENFTESNLDLNTFKSNLGENLTVESNDYENLLANNTKLVLENIKSLKFVPLSFYIFPQNSNYDFSDVFKEQLSLPGSNPNTFTNHKHEHFNVNKTQFDLKQLKVTNQKIYENNSNTATKIWWVARGNIVFKFIIENNNIKLSNQILYFQYANNKSLNSKLNKDGFETELDAINHFFNPREITQELINQYEEYSISKVLGPAIIIQLKP